MDYLIFLIGFIILCFIVIIAAGFFEAKLKKKHEPAAVKPEDSPAPEKSSEFIEGRIYQMEDGSFAKYVGNGKFLKVKE